MIQDLKGDLLMKKTTKKTLGSVVLTLLLFITGGTYTLHERANQKVNEIKELILHSDLPKSEKDELLKTLEQLSQSTEEYLSFSDEVNDHIETNDLEKVEDEKETSNKKPDFLSINKTVNIPQYSGESYVMVNGNKPFFKKEEMTTESFEYYSELDHLGRPQTAYANINQKMMPKDKRGSIGMVKPAGWHTVRYDDLINGKYLYNRCHLIGYQLAGENANKKNLITGTRSLNVDGMLPFENMVDDYVEQTNHHVLYRVTPIYNGNNLVADGVLMEAKSVEDNGKGIQFNVFVYNVQKGVAINYATGTSKKGKTTLVPAKIPAYIIKSENTVNTTKPDPSLIKVWVASSGKGTKYHARKDCPNLKESKTMSLKEAKDKGYTPCKTCN